jgi:hypothetical protein
MSVALHLSGKKGSQEMKYYIHVITRARNTGKVTRNVLFGTGYRSMSVRYTSLSKRTSRNVPTSSILQLFNCNYQDAELTVLENDGKIFGQEIQPIYVRCISYAKNFTQRPRIRILHFFVITKMRSSRYRKLEGYLCEMSVCIDNNNIIKI